MSGTALFVVNGQNEISTDRAQFAVASLGVNILMLTMGIFKLQIKNLA